MIKFQVKNISNSFGSLICQRHAGLFTIHKHSDYIGIIDKERYQQGCSLKYENKWSWELYTARHTVFDVDVVR